MQKTEKKSIVVVRPGAIGDTVLTIPVLELIKQRYPDSSMAFVGNAFVLPLLALWGIVDEVYDYQERRWSALFANDSRFCAQDELLLRSDYTICWLRDTEGMVRRNLAALGTPEVVIAPGRPPEAVAAPLHCVEYLAQTLGVSLSLNEFIRSAYSVVPRDRSFNGMQRCVAIHPGSGGVRKCWSLEHFVNVIQRLWQQNYTVLVLLGPAEEEQMPRLLHLLGSPPQPAQFNILAQAPILQIVAALQSCCAYLGNDSGITHLAAMMGLPTIALFGASNPAIWQPVGPSVHLLHDPGFLKLRPQDVFDVLIKEINR